MNGLPIDNDSLFQIGSNTKSFVAVIILQLESEQKLSISNTVDDFFPNEYPKWKNITVKQLLNMTSGIQNYFTPEVPIWQEIREKPYNTFTTDDLLNSVKNLDLTFIPGTKWDYSNTNYVLAGKIIEKVTSLSLTEEIENRIIKPLHLKHTYYIHSFPKQEIASSDLPHLMSGYYTFADYILKPYYTYGQDIIDYSMSMFNAAGSIISSSSDLNTYAQTLFSTDPNKRLLPQRQLDELVSLVDMTDGSPLPEGVNNEHSQGYGLGIIGTYDKSLNIISYEHGGGTYGFLSTWHYLPKEKASFVYAINNSMPSETFNSELLDPLIKIFYQNCLML
jgi:D-alanyl-D-alanine carboxypeptidase